MTLRHTFCDAECACSHAAHAVAVKCMPDAVLVAAVNDRLLLLHMLPRRR